MENLWGFKIIIKFGRDFGNCLPKQNAQNLQNCIRFYYKPPHNYKNYCEFAKKNSLRERALKISNIASVLIAYNNNFNDVITCTESSWKLTKLLKIHWINAWFFIVSENWIILNLFFISHQASSGSAHKVGSASRGAFNAISPTKTPIKTTTDDTPDFDRTRVRAFELKYKAVITYIFCFIGLTWYSW